MTIGPLHELCTFNFKRLTNPAQAQDSQKIHIFVWWYQPCTQCVYNWGGGVQPQCIIYVFRNNVVNSDRIICCFRSWIQINWLQTSGGLLVSVPNARALRRSWWHLWSLQHAQSHWCLQQQLVPQIKKAAIRDILLQSFSPVQAVHVRMTISFSNRVC